MHVKNSSCIFVIRNKETKGMLKTLKKKSKHKTNKKSKSYENRNF